jgi:Uma2 family endonuclease
MVDTDLSDDTVALPRRLVRWPLEVVPPEGFDPDDLATWPSLAGRLEWVKGRLLYMPPCGDRQSDTVSDLATELGLWRRSHPEFVTSTNEAGVKLEGDVRGADAAIFREEDVGPMTGGLRHVAPVLAAEVSGREPEPFDEKAAWYLDRGVVVVWILFVERRVVRIVTRSGTTEHAVGERIPEHPALPDLSPRVEDLFAQVLRAR